MDWLTVIISLLVLGAVIHFLIETIYFIRVGICYVLAKFVKRKVHILEKCSIGGECLKRSLWACFTVRSLPQEFAPPKTLTWFWRTWTMLDTFERLTWHASISTWDRDSSMSLEAKRVRFCWVQQMWDFESSLDSLIALRSQQKSRIGTKTAFSSSTGSLARMDLFMQRCYVNSEWLTVPVKLWWTFYSNKEARFCQSLKCLWR